MIRFIYTGDWHRRGTNPRNRLDDYVAAHDSKLNEVFELAVKWEAEAIIMPGDVFDRPEVSIAVLLAFAEILNKTQVPIYLTPGNHDIYGYNVATYWRSSLRLLEMLVPQLHVITDTTDRVSFLKGGDLVALSFTPYSAKMDVNGYGYDPNGHTQEEPQHEAPSALDAYKIHVAHGMLLDHTPPFDRYTLLEEVYTTADMVLTGHDHTGYGVYKRKDGKIFCNPGSLTRLAASVNEIERPIQVAVITVDGTKGGIKLIPLQSAKPGEEVLDRSKIEAEKQRQYSMEQFSALIENTVGERVLLDVNQIIETIAEVEQSAPHIVKAALQIIDEQREKVK